MNKWDAGLLPPEGRVVAGFSGGADSTALAHWLLGQVGRERLLLAHVNHGLRGAESARDEDHARAFAQKWGLALKVRRADVGALAKEEGSGLEECGRRVRYAFFESLATGEYDCICTAHTADDNVETLLLHLSRGASLQGLCGIPAKRGRVLRPLLAVTREEVEAYCACQGLSYVTDSSNLSLNYARNRVRQQVVPVLRAINPQFTAAACRAIQQLSCDRDYLEGEAAKLLEGARRPYGLSCRALREAHPSLQGRALRQYLAAAGCQDVEEKHIALAAQLLTQDGGLSLPGGVQAVSGLGLFYAQVPAAFEGFALPAALGETPLPGGRRLVLEKIYGGKPGNRGKIQNLLFKNGLDYATIYGTSQSAAPLIARTRRPGDRFAPAGRGVTKPLKQVLREAGIPPWAREQVVLLEKAGQLVYCQGVGAAEGFAPQPGAARLAVAIT